MPSRLAGVRAGSGNPASWPRAALLGELQPDLILLDMMMPEVDGFEVLARVRANPDSAHIPLLIVSALGDALCIDDEAAETLGVAGILTKPVAVATLIRHVRAIVGPGAVPGAPAVGMDRPDGASGAA